MPMIREFQGRTVNRTIRVGDQIAILFQSGQIGTAGESILVPLDQYLAERKVAYITNGTVREVEAISSK